MDDDDKIEKLPVRFKERNLDAFLVVANRYGGCSHSRFIIDNKKSEVECAECGEKMNPMWVLSRLTAEETRWHRAHERYQDETKRLKERSRTKCNYCGKMTHISRR